MQNNGVWIPLIASVGVGAATFYSMTKHNQNLGQTMQQMIPLVSQMNGGGNQQSQMNTNSDGGQQQSQSQQLGPYGMS
ncbi:hypothetical protein ACDX78_08780 [Virgibacillus oceani]